MTPVVVEVDESHQGRFVEGNSLLRGDFVERVVNVRQVIGGDIADEGARDFVISHAAMQPAQKQNELHSDGKGRREQAEPMSEHGILNMKERSGRKGFHMLSALWSLRTSC